MFKHNSTTGNVAVISKKKVSGLTAKKMAYLAGGYLADCENLSKMELRQRYKSEANTHRNMLAREKSHGAVVHPDFRDFASFLRLVGPKPAIGATLDRIDNDDPEYAPGKVRWADKRTQNNNKSDTLIFYYSRTGDTYTTSRLAKLRGVTPSTIRKRRERGWTDDEIIEGKRTPHSASSPCAPAHVAATVRSPSISMALSAKEIAFNEMVEYYEYHRRVDGEQPFPAPLEFLNESIADLGLVISPEGYERKFRKFWPEHKPHVIFEELPISQQNLIAVIDPDYVAAVKEKAAKRKLLEDQL